MIAFKTSSKSLAFLQEIATSASPPRNDSAMTVRRFIRYGLLGNGIIRNYYLYGPVMIIVIISG
jgi:hypothetical protein